MTQPCSCLGSAPKPANAGLDPGSRPGRGDESRLARGTLAGGRTATKTPTPAQAPVRPQLAHDTAAQPPHNACECLGPHSAPHTPHTPPVQCPHTHAVRPPPRAAPGPTHRSGREPGTAAPHWAGTWQGRGPHASGRAANRSARPGARPAPHAGQGAARPRRPRPSRRDEAAPPWWAGRRLPPRPRPLRRRPASVSPSVKWAGGAGCSLTPLSLLTRPVNHSVTAGTAGVTPAVLVRPSGDGAEAVPRPPARPSAASRCRLTFILCGTTPTSRLEKSSEETQKRLSPPIP